MWGHAATSARWEQVPACSEIVRTQYAGATDAHELVVGGSLAYVCDMPINEVPRVEWTQALNRFTAAHEGWLVSLEIFGPYLGAQPEINHMPLLGVSADRVNHDGVIAISVARSASDHFTHMVHDVSRIFIEQTDDGATAALLIESTDATRTVLQLRAVGSPPART